MKKFKSILKTKEVGMHAHNNQQLGFANTIESIIYDANFVDGTVFGIGRAAGNCPLELILGFLKNPKFDLKSGSFETLIHLADEGLGMTLLPYLQTLHMGEKAKKNLRYFNTPAPAREISLSFYKTQIKPPVIHALR